MAAFDPRVARALAAPARADILRHLEDSGQAQTVEEIAAVVGLHVNTVRSHLDVLADVGLVSRDGERRRGPGRPRVLYVARAVEADPAVEVDPADRSRDEFRSLAEVLADELALALPDPSAAAMQAGQRWAERLSRARSADGARSAGNGAGPAGDPSATDVIVTAADATVTATDATASVVALLDRLGFAPETEPLGDRIYIRSCPFRGSPRRNSRVLCDVHLGLIRGAFAEFGAGVAVSGCDARVREQLCVVHLVRASGSDDPAPSPIGSGDQPAVPANA